MKSTTRRRGKQYIDTVAANKIRKTSYKPPLTESPLVSYLLIGAANEGYWNSFRMALQFEDVVDCLKVLYPQFDIVFLFDHSQGHARKKRALLTQKKSRRIVEVRNRSCETQRSRLWRACLDLTHLTYRLEMSSSWYSSPKISAHGIWRIINRGRREDTIYQLGPASVLNEQRYNSLRHWNRPGVCATRDKPQ